MTQVTWCGPVGACPGVNPRAEKAKPTKGAGDAGPGGRLDRVSPGMGQDSPFSGLSLFSPAALAPGPDLGRFHTIR